MNVYLSQVNNTYGRNAFLPYSVGLLQAYAMSHPIIVDNFDFKGLIFLRENIDDVVARMDNPTIFGASCYIWNWQYSLTLAKKVKQKFPKCLIILGGPQVPDNVDHEFRVKYPFVDILVHGEGEKTFTDILIESIYRADYAGLPGITDMTLKGIFKSKPRERERNPDHFPSPYLTGVFDKIMKMDYDFHASQETHRGCPYSCTFCDWGSNTMSKMGLFSIERLKMEIEWFAENKIDLLYNCDANFGLYKRDLQIAEALVEAKARTGFPNKFRAAYAKNSNDLVFKISSKLHDAGMSKGATLSLQSVNEKVLENIKRKNMKINDFSSLMAKYNRKGMPTYTELIIGLPGETYDSFADGLSLLLDAGQHDSLQVYNCEILPNAEMNNPEYRKKHGIESVSVPVLFFHGTPSKDEIIEMYDLVVQTNTLPLIDWVKTHQISWLVQCMHCLSLTQTIAIFLKNLRGIPYRKFYESIMSFCLEKPDTVAGRAFKTATQLFEDIPSGKGWGWIDPRFGNIVWPPEEGGFLSIIAEKDKFYEEIRPLVQSMTLDGELTEDLITYQKNAIRDHTQPAKFEFQCESQVHEFVSSIRNGEPSPLKCGSVKYTIESDKEFSGDLETYAREIVWYGRKGGKFMHKVIRHV